MVHTNKCMSCGKEIFIVYIADWISGLITDKEVYSIDLCNECNTHMIDAVKKAWGEIKK